MRFEPKFCCFCGEKIERVGGQLFSSSSFCDDCAKEYETKKRIKLGLAAGLIFVFGMFASMLVLPSKTPVAVATTAQNLTSPAQVHNSQPPNNKIQTAPALANAISQAAQSPQPLQANRNVPTVAPLVEVPTTTEVAHYCGARTQKGTPCTRRVKNAGRCWQHIGKPAMLPDEKLLINR